MRVDVSAALRERFLTSGGGDAGIASAVAELAHELATAGRFDDAAEDALIAELQRIRGRRRRDPKGLVLTPTRVADALAELMRRRFGPEYDRGRVAFDPAAGSGRLLRPLSDRFELYGIDIDPAVSAIAGAFGVSVEVADGLSTPRPPGRTGELLFVCNPPWVSGYARVSQRSKLDLDRVQRVAARWGSGRVNPAVAFVARVVRDLMRSGEICGFVIPDALLTAPSYASLRDELRRLCDVVVVAELGDNLFEDRVVRPSLLVARRRGESAIDSAATRGCDVEFVAGLSADDWGNPADWWRLSDEDLSLVGGIFAGRGEWSELAWKLARGSAVLGDLVSIHDGVNPGSRAARRALIRESSLGMGQPSLLVEGRDLRPEGIGPSRSWIERDPAAVRKEWRRGGTSLRSAELFAGPRLYSRQTASRLVVAYTDDDRVALNSVHIMRWKGRRGAAENLRVLAALLNSEAVSGVYRALFAERRTVFPQVKIVHLRRLPMLWPPPSDVRAAALRCEGTPAGSSARAELDVALLSWWREPGTATPSV